MRFKFAFCSKGMETIQIIKITIIFSCYYLNNADIFYCKIMHFFSGWNHLAIWVMLWNISRIHFFFFLFFSVQYCYIVTLFLHYCIFTLMLQCYIIFLRCKICSFPLKFVYKWFNFCYSLGIFFISLWFNATVAVYWKHLLSFRESIYDRPRIGFILWYL